MNLKHGDVITLDNGDTVKVSLEVIAKKVTKLEPNRIYNLKYNGQYCNIKGSNGIEDASTIRDCNWRYVGNVQLLGNGGRNIFISTNSDRYLMMGDGNLDYVISEVV